MLYRKKNPHGGAAFEPGVTLDMSAHTNPLGTAPGVLEAVRESLARVRDYPDPYCRDLVAAIAAFEHVPPEYVLCGNGAAELICAYAAAVRQHLPRSMIQAPQGVFFIFYRWHGGLKNVCRKNVDWHGKKDSGGKDKNV